MSDSPSLISNWISFRTMVTPVLLKVVFQFHFWIMNVGGILLILGIDVLLILRGLGIAFGDGGMGVIMLVFAIVMAVVVLVVGLILLVAANIATRVSYELALLLFNIYESLKVIEAQLVQQRPEVQAQFAMNDAQA